MYQKKRTVDDDKDWNLVMAVYNLIEYSFSVFWHDSYIMVLF